MAKKWKSKAVSKKVSDFKKILDEEFVIKRQKPPRQSEPTCENPAEMPGTSGMAHDVSYAAADKSNSRLTYDSLASSTWSKGSVSINCV